MFQALILSGLGTDYSANTGYDSSTAISSFGIGVQGLNHENVEKVQFLLFSARNYENHIGDMPPWCSFFNVLCKVEGKIQEVLEKVHQSGFDKRRIQATIHQLELGLKHVRTSHHSPSNNRR